MNKRQQEKYYKNKFKRLFSVLFEMQGVRVKPSRVKLDPRGIYWEHDTPNMAAKAAGYELRLHFGSKEAADDPVNNNPGI